MKDFALTTLIALLACSYLHAQAPSPALPEMQPLSARFAAAIQTVAAAQSDKRDKLKAEYLLLLDTVFKQVAATGDLDATLQVKAEKERVQKGEALTDPIKTAMIPALRAARDKYDKALEPLQAEERTAENAARRQYIVELDLLQKELTKRTELEKALTVRAEREQIAGQMAAAGGAPTGSAAGIPAPAGGMNPLLLSNYYERLAKALRGPKKTTPIGSRKEGSEFTALPKEGAQLVGLAVKKGDWFGTPIISALEPIYESQTGRSRGPAIGGKTDEFPLVVEAKPGYVVSELIVSAPENHVHGVKLVFRKLDVFHESLLLGDSYESDWLGVELKGKSARVGDPARPAIGLCGRAGDWVAALGLLDAP